jgi:hypothetical protein
LLHVTGVSNPNVPGGTATVDLTTPGVALIKVVFTAPVSGANLELTRLIADVPAGATYGAKQLLDIRNIVIDAGAVAAQGGRWHRGGRLHRRRYVQALRILCST